MIQHTLFNKLTLDRIEEVFAHHFAGELQQWLARWRESVAVGDVQGRSFYISVNERFHMDGIFLHDTERAEGVVFALTSEVAENLRRRAERNGVVNVIFQKVLE